MREVGCLLIEELPDRLLRQPELLPDGLGGDPCLGGLVEPLLDHLLASLGDLLQQDELLDLLAERVDVEPGALHRQLPSYLNEMFTRAR